MTQDAWLQWGTTILLPAAVGALVGAAGVLWVARLICVSLPTTLYIRGAGGLTSLQPIVSDLVQIMVRSAAAAGCTWLLWHYAPERLTPYWVGLVLPLVFGSGRLRRSAKNLNEYLDVHGRYVTPSMMDELRREGRKARGVREPTEPPRA